MPHNRKRLREVLAPGVLPKERVGNAANPQDQRLPEKESDDLSQG